MLTAGIVVVTHPGKASEVEHQLAVVPEIRIHGRAADDRLTGVCTVPPGETLTAFLERIAADIPAIVLIQPTFVSE